MKKRFGLCAVLFLLVATLLSACATSQNSMSGDSSEAAASGTPVPGEKLNDEGRFTPGGPGASGNVHW